MASLGPKILLVTNIERGQSNVFLATAAALLRNAPNLQLHFATFPGLENDVCAISNDAIRDNRSTKPITYHAVEGLSMFEGLQALMARSRFGSNDAYPLPLSFCKPLSFRTTMRAIRDAAPMFHIYDGPAFFQIYSSVARIVTDIKPDLIICDISSSPALTACWDCGIPFTWLVPNSIKDVSNLCQPHLAALWKFPALMTGYTFPVPWHLIPVNLFFTLYLLYIVYSNPTMRETQKYVSARTGYPVRTILDLERNKPAGLKILVGSLPELDFPLICPPYVCPCGPIIRSAPPIRESDADLAAWLDNGPTIYVNLGSHLRLPEDWAVELARALDITIKVLDSRRPESPPFQVLWKLRKLGEYDATTASSRIGNILGEKLNSGRVSIVDWIQASPLSVLQSGQIVCALHHGGANSYYEAVVAGIPQVVLPQWTDCYDYAERVEWLGIGKVGSRKRKPLPEAAELSEQLLAVIDGESGLSAKNKAQQLAGICKSNGNGAKNAANAILELLSQSS